MFLMFSLLMLFMFLFIFFIILFYENSFSLSLNYFFFELDFMNNFQWNFSLSWICLTFFLMVFIVVFLVSSYSEFYLEYYNNKKFFSLLVLFFFSMIFLVSSNSFLPLFLGWEGLGISSLFLIMFYPNKTSMFNSFLTFFFNRLGDIGFLLSCCIFLNNFPMLFNFSLMNFSLIFLILICSFTKSAQFPFSSWLPAAMSAPTPISAMVHSSTLVTAGIFICLLLNSMIWSFGLSSFFFFFSLLSFFYGGMLALIELDFKKIIAFSTMSQISMIMLFCSLHMVNLALLHMFYHAMFKSFIFCVCGIMFMSVFSDQLLKNMSFIKMDKKITSILVVNIYFMSGLIFSSSFYSKDFFLELINASMLSFLFILFLMGSVLTLLYSTKILSSSSNKSSIKLISVKNFSLPSFIFFFFFLILMTEFFSSIYFMDCMNLLSNFDVALILLVFIFIVFLNVNFKFKSLFFFSYSVGFTKNLSFSDFSIFFNLIKFMGNDSFFFKPTFFYGLKFFKIPFMVNFFNEFSQFFFFFLLLLLIYFF